MGEMEFKDLSPLEQAVIRRTHPISFVLHALALIWGGYFLWIHSWLGALACIMGGLLLATLVARTDRNFLNTLKVGLNPFQRLLLYHVDLKNMALHFLALVAFVWGAWSHSPEFLLASVSFALLGNALPWLRHSREASVYALAIGEDRP